MNDGTYGGRQAEEARPQRTESISWLIKDFITVTPGPFHPAPLTTLPLPLTRGPEGRPKAGPRVGVMEEDGRRACGVKKERNRRV